MGQLLEELIVSQADRNRLNPIGFPDFGILPLYYFAPTLIDFYKSDHVHQYPKGTKQVWVNWVPRYCRDKNIKSMVFFGQQYYMKFYLQKIWKHTFFDRDWSEVGEFYDRFLRTTLNRKIDLGHMRELHQHGFLPIKIYALPEGTNVNLGVPAYVMTNTIPDAFWLPNYLESNESNVMWKACNSASTAQRYRQMFIKYAKMAGETDLKPVNKQGHDFSYRGMSGTEDAVLSGVGHLLSFDGTDTCPAILAAMQFYDAIMDCGGSVAATEHSVMCAGGKEDEIETYRRLIQDVYQDGVVSIVSDTWDLWKVLTEYTRDLKEIILTRDGIVVFRPDSGNPVTILCGESSDPGRFALPRDKGVFRCLGESLGWVIRPKYLPLLNKSAAIYGDSISEERADAILNRMVNELKISPYNVVFGIGSYTYTYTTRDFFGQALKATAVRTADGTIKNIFKKPVTDDGTKNSLLGIPAVYRTEDSTEEHPSYYTVQEATEEQLANCAFRETFCDGKILIDESFETVRQRVRA